MSGGRLQMKLIYGLATLTWGNPTLPSAMHRFTTEFGMGSGGSNALWSSRNSVARMSRWTAQRIRICDICDVACELSVRFVFTTAICASKLLGCYMVKPHGQLVLVSSTPHSAYTPNLSTS